MPFTIESTVRRDDLRTSKQLRMGAVTGYPAQQRPSTNIGPLVGPSQRLDGSLGPPGYSQPGKYFLPSSTRNICTHLLPGLPRQFPWVNAPAPILEDLVQRSQRFTCRDLGGAVEKFGLSEAELVSKYCLPL